jgi:hypothetical protein
LALETAILYCYGSRHTGFGGEPLRNGLRRLLVVSVLVFVASALTLVVGYALIPRSSKPSHAASAAAPRPTPISDVEVCGLITSDEVQRLLNFASATGPGTPQPDFAGGACAWGTGLGESFELTVVPYQRGPNFRPCARIVGTEIHVAGWVGCSRLEFGPGNVLTAFKGSYSVSIEPEVNVIGYPYELAEESTISHVFRLLSASSTGGEGVT